MCWDRRRMEVRSTPLSALMRATLDCRHICLAFLVTNTLAGLRRRLAGPHFRGVPAMLLVSCKSLAGIASLSLTC